MHNKIFVSSKQLLGIQKLQEKIYSDQFSMAENMTNNSAYCAFQCNFYCLHILHLIIHCHILGKC